MIALDKDWAEGDKVISITPFNERQERKKREGRRTLPQLQGGW